MAQDERQRTIIEEAITRFTHFGVAKTTMAEIAGDLSFSKASLYYYFPDKISLYAEVIKTITGQSAGAVDEAIAKESDLFKAVLIFLERCTNFITRYPNIPGYLKNFGPSKIPVERQPIFTQLRKREPGALNQHH